MANSVDGGRLSHKRVVPSTRKKPQSWIQHFLFLLFGLVFLLSLAIFFAINDEAFSNGKSFKTTEPIVTSRTEHIFSIEPKVPEITKNSAILQPQKKPIVTDILPIFATDSHGVPEKHIRYKLIFSTGDCSIREQRQ